MLGKRIALCLVLLCGTIVVPGQKSVNSRTFNGGTQWADGSPMPIPHAPGAVLVADGSPMPIPHAPGAVLVADGSPMPIPHAPGEWVA